jgi:large subunit ribosomal protein L21
MYAIIETGGKQYKVAPGDEIFIEKLEVNEGDKITFDKVFAVGGEGDLKIGSPDLKAKVIATVIKNGKSKKIRIFKMKPKKGYRKRKGHRQPYTKVKIDEITA